MEQELEGYRGRFAGIRTGLSREVNLGQSLIEEILEELERTKTTLKQTKLDLDKLQAKRPFVVVLIDADADDYVFNDHFINKGAKGGEEAADALLAASRRYLRGVASEINEVDILVRAFANMNGLGTTLEKTGRLKDADLLRAFAIGFNRRQAFFDFVDVRTGKETADLKVQENIKFFLDSIQCKHLVLACGHDAGYAPFLGQFVGDKHTVDRITLLENNTCPAAIKDLGLRKTQFISVFNTVTQLKGLPGQAWVRDGTMSTVLAPFTDRGGDSERPKVMSRKIKDPPSKEQSKVQAQSNRLGPVITDANGRRVDRPLQVDKGVIERIRKGTLCYYYFLRGECVADDCDRNQVHRPLLDREFDALWWLARQGRCYKSQKADREPRKDCSDVMCVYSHKSGDVCKST